MKFVRPLMALRTYCRIQRILRKFLALPFISRGKILIEIDVKDFFMSGRHPDLVKLCSDQIDIHIQSAFRNLLGFIIGKQFVSIDESDQIYKVLVGSGMGIGCSGDVSDLALAVLAELNFALDPEVQAKFEMDLYVRFRDDIFIILGGSPELRREFIDEFRKRTSFSAFLLKELAAVR